jgi:UMF1 family MFS transporter
MLNDLSLPENRSRVSGIGQGANSIGQVLGLLATLPLAKGTIVFFGEPGRAQTLLPSAILFLLFALPMLIFYKEENRAARNAPALTTSSFRALLTSKPLVLLLVAYFLFSDAFLTFASNFPLYLETIHKAPDTTKALVSIGVLALASVGAVIFGKIADKKGELKTLKFILIVWCFIFPAIAFIPTLNLLIPIFLFAGIFFGPVWAISRSLVGQLAPQGLVASAYSYYVVAERFATFIGPLVWSGALIWLGEGKAGYQAALISMSGLLIIGLLILNRLQKHLTQSSSNINP